MSKIKQDKRIYFDYASTTPVDLKVLRAMMPFFSKRFYNTSALYREGIETRAELERFRKKVSGLLSAHPDEVIFTGSGTESNNIAILGVVSLSLKKIARPHVIVSAIEHPSVLALEREILNRGGRMSILPVDENGVADLKSLSSLLSKDTVLVSIMYANNEIGTIEPIKEISKIIRFFKKNQKIKSPYPYFHTDASQAANYLSLNTLELGVDLLSLDGSKIYGPKGVGALWFRRGLLLSPIIFGGGQEGGLRSGTENLALIAGFSSALDIACSMREKESQRLSILRDKLISQILKKFNDAHLNGDPIHRLPNNINICFPNIDAEHAVILADTFGVLCSTASSCKTLSEDLQSEVIMALGKEKECSRSSIRFSLGRQTTVDDIKVLLSRLPKIISRTGAI